MSRNGLHPDVERVLELIARAGHPEYHQMSAAEARAFHELHAPALAIEPLALPRVHDLTLPGPGGALTARVYSPLAEPRRAPVVLWLHGGGHTVGSIATYDSICRRLAARSGALVMSLGYRLAPEHRFPAAVDDAYAALEWLVRNAARIGGDASRIALAGDSAGGNLAAVSALRARDEGLVGLVHQLLVYPAVAGHLDFPSHHRFGRDHLLTREVIVWFQTQYLRHGGDRGDWRFAPLSAPSHSDLAPATIVVASHDPLRDEGVVYAEALRRAGTAARLIEVDGMVHGFWSMGGAVGPAVHSLDAAGEMLARAFEDRSARPRGRAQ